MSATKEKLACAANPCASCPYAKTTPPGVWDASEYRKLPAWDEPMNYPGLFLCHHSNLGGRESVCRGWLEVHSNNIGVRLAMAMRIDLKHREPTKVPLYASGAAACRAGLRGVRKPSPKAKAICQKLTRARIALASSPAGESK